MIIVSLYGGLVSQIRAFYMAYKLGKKFGDVLILDLSNYYNGYYRPYILDYLAISDCMRIAVRGGMNDRLRFLGNICRQKIQTIENGEELEWVYNHFNSEKAYYLVNDCCFYDDFCRKHQEFFFRYIGDDIATLEIMNMLQMSCLSEYISNFDKQIRNKESVGVHIRLQDFIQVGWMVEEDYAFYRAAIQWFRLKLKEPLFIVFSDDIGLAKKILGATADIYYVENTGCDKNDVEQLLCLSKCKHRVLSKKSGFSLFASTIAQNRWKSQGYTLIIKEMNLAQNAGEKDYVDKNFNRSPFLKWEDSLCNCVQLDKKEIQELDRRYLEYKNCDIEENDILDISNERNKGESIVIFATLQTFSETVITGMERMAKRVAELNNEVHFIGEKNNLDSKGGDGFFWTIQNAHQAKDFNGDSLGYTLYFYEELNRNDNYLDFIRHICQDRENEKIYVIVRKSQALPLLREHENFKNIKFIFIDFTSEFEVENRKAILKDDLHYLYTNADMVITFNRLICEEYKNELQKIEYVDLKKFFPDTRIWDKRLENLDELNKCEDKLYEYIFDVIRRTWH